MARVETIGNATLYLGDCREILPTLGKVDAVVTDPPYGIDYSKSQFGRVFGDDGEPDLSFIFSMSCHKVIFGANNFIRQLPHRGRWLCWDKRNNDEKTDRIIGSPFELAWEDRKSGYYRIIRLLHAGAINADGQGIIKRQHPTQKPIELMKRCISFYKDAIIIADPFMGVGATGIAAIKLGRQFVGIEIDPKYFDIACHRIDEATRQPDMFIKPAKEIQQSFPMEAGQ